MPNNIKRIAVIGSNGGIGRRLVDHLSCHERWAVRGLDLQPKTEAAVNDGYLQADLQEMLVNVAVRKNIIQYLRDVDTVVMLAATVHSNRARRKDYRRLNVEVPREVIRILADQSDMSRRFVFASTISVYGPSPDSIITEASPTNPSSPYARSKLRAETVLRQIAASQNSVEYVALRLGTLINRRDRGNLVRLMRTASKYLTLPRVPHGISKSFVDIRDVCVAIERCIGRDCLPFDTYNIVAPPVDLSEIMDLVSRAACVRFRPFLPKVLLQAISPTLSRSVSVSGGRSEETFSMTYASFPTAFQREFMEPTKQ